LVVLRVSGERCVVQQRLERTHWQNCTDPDAILAAHPAQLTAALKAGGMLPELRVERMKEVSARIKNEFDVDLRASLAGPITKIRKVLESFPSIADPGADRILLFARIQPVAAVPSNCTGVLERIKNGHEEKNYTAPVTARSSA
jgi:endonuclease III-like uncharacterized protein